MSVGALVSTDALQEDPAEKNALKTLCNDAAQETNGNAEVPPSDAATMIMLK